MFVQIWKAPLFFLGNSISVVWELFNWGKFWCTLAMVSKHNILNVTAIAQLPKYYLKNCPLARKDNLQIPYRHQPTFNILIQKHGQRLDIGVILSD